MLNPVRSKLAFGVSFCDDLLHLRWPVVPAFNSAQLERFQCQAQSSSAYLCAYACMGLRTSSSSFLVSSAEAGTLFGDLVWAWGRTRGM